MSVCVRVWLTKCVRPYSVAGRKETNRKSRHDYGDDDDDENNVDENALERGVSRHGWVQRRLGIRGRGTHFANV